MSRSIQLGDQLGLPPRERIDTLPQDVPKWTLGFHAAAWMVDNLIQPNGKNAGKPFIPTDRQIQFLLDFYEINEEGEFIYRHAVRRLSKGAGKMLPLSERVFTPEGWVRYGDLRPGDRVFAADGSPTRVTQVHPVGWMDSYRVRFSDGASVVAGGEHLFTVEEFVGSRGRKVRTLSVEEMLREGLTYERPLTGGSTKAVNPGVGKFSLPAYGPLVMPERRLPVDPYVLGVWLADGDSDSGRITFHEHDGDWLASRFRRAGFPFGKWDRKGGRGRRATAKGLRRELSKLGLLDNKHIPRDYLMGSVGQRTALLAGLLDGDGYVGPDGRAELSQKRRHLAEDAAFLLRSLGIRVNVKRGRSWLDGKRMADRYRLAFKPYQHHGVFQLPRKAKRVRRCERKPMPRVVKSITRVDPVPMRCITIEHPDGMFLVGEQMIVTHNSPFAASVALFELLGPSRFGSFNEDAPFGIEAVPASMPWIQLVATSEKQVGNTMRMVRAFCNKRSQLAKTYGLDPGKTYIETGANGKLEQVTSSANTMEGAEVSFMVADEALALDTPIPTPDGWTTPANIQVGDWIYGSDGRPVRVSYVTPVFEGRPCSRVTFSDGASIVCDDGHLWDVKVVGSSTRGVWSTSRMREDGRRLCVPRMRPAVMPVQDVPVDPWLLGYWLGNGSARWASVTCHEDDAQFVIDRARERGVPLADIVKGGKGKAVCVSLKGSPDGRLYSKDGSSFRARLSSVGLLGNKHIPAVYFRASVGQRLELVRGLMDSDGSINSNGSAVFVNHDKGLVDGLVQLLASLGVHASVSSRVDERWEHRPTTYKVSFRPDTDLNVFALPRKAQLVREPSARRFRSIESITPVPSVPVRCIEVEADDHLFVAGEGWVVTHNTEHWLPSQGGPELMSTMKQNAAKTGARIMETSNAWEPGIESVAEKTYEAWCDQEEGKTKSDLKILYDARIAPPYAVLHDKPGDGQIGVTDTLKWIYEDSPWVNLRSIKGQIMDPAYPESRSLRFFFNKPTAVEASWVTLDEWVLLADRERKVQDGEEIVMFFDGSKSNDHTALVGCCMSDGHIFKIGHWAPDKHTGNVNVGAVDAGVRTAFDRWDVVAFWADVREWESFVRVAWPDEFGERLIMPAVKHGMNASPVAWDMRSHSYQFAEACETVFNEVQEKAFSHDGDPDLGLHVSHCRQHELRGRFTVKKESPKSPKKIDLAVCMIGARMLYRHVKASDEWAERSAPKPGWGIL